jgi:hypothetical protein
MKIVVDKFTEFLVTGHEFLILFKGSGSLKTFEVREVF